MKETKKDNLIEEMKKQNLNLREWLTLTEAAKCSIYSKRQIYKLAEKSNQRIRTKKENKHVLFNKLDILQYAASHPRDIILNTVWDEIDYKEGEYFYPLFGYDCKYFISNKQRVINTSTGQVLTPKLQTDIKGNKTGYKQITLQKNGKSKVELLHRLIGKTQCKNSLGKDIFHHIKIAFPSNDKASNLLPVWKFQHDKLHKFLVEGKEKEYKEMIKLIKKENSQKVYKIPHPDYEPNDKFKYYMFVTADGNKAYKIGKEIPFNSIVMESAELQTEG